MFSVHHCVVGFRKLSGNLRGLASALAEIKTGQSQDWSYWALCALFGTQLTTRRTERRQLTNELAPVRNHSHVAAQYDEPVCPTDDTAIGAHSTHPGTPFALALARHTSERCPLTSHIENDRCKDALNDAWRRTRDGNERLAPQHEHSGNSVNPPNSYILMLLLVTPFDTLPAPAPQNPRTLAQWEDRTAFRQDAEKKEVFKHLAAPAHVSERRSIADTRTSSQSSPSRNKVFQTRRALFHLIGDILSLYVRHLALSKSSGASKRGRGRPRRPDDTANIIDLVRFLEGPLKVHNLDERERAA